MLKPTTLFMNTEHMKNLGGLAESRGLKTAQLVRVAIAEFLRRETRKK
jgi:hypothetical protein